MNQSIHLLWAVMTLTLVSSCQHNAPAAALAQSWETAMTVEGSPDSSVSESCIVSGVEQCFDAIDNNCNGLLDEGCGLRSGPIHVEIAWNVPDADVDLMVTGPSGQRVRKGRTTRDGLRKDRYCPSKSPSCFGQNVENVYLFKARAVPGTYIIEVKLMSAGQDRPEVNVQLGIRAGARVISSTMSLGEPGATRKVRLNIPGNKPAEGTGLRSGRAK